MDHKTLPPPDSTAAYPSRSASSSSAPPPSSSSSDASSSSSSASTSVPTTTTVTTKKKEEDGKTLNILLADQSGNEIHFKVKPTTKFAKVFASYAKNSESKGTAIPGAVRFLFDGKRVLPDQTPAQLEMEDGDKIDVMIPQTGGVGAVDS